MFRRSMLLASAAIGAAGARDVEHDEQAAGGAGREGREDLDDRQPGQERMRTDGGHAFADGSPAGDGQVPGIATGALVKRFDEPDPAVVPLATALNRGARRVQTISPFADVASTERPPAAPFVHNTDATVSPHLQRPGPIIDIYQLE